MAMAASKVAYPEVEDDDVPEHLTCPVCFNLPEAEVYQCVNGHVLCSQCFFKPEIDNCPQCRYEFRNGPQIRSRHFEELAAQYVKVDCCFKSNGCKQKIRKLLLQDHKDGCRFNFEKYGDPVSLCKTMKLNCSFQFNNGNTEEAVDHFKCVHGAKVTKMEEFRMEIPNFREGIKNCSEDFKYWTPVIADLKDKRCYLICFAKWDVKNGLLKFNSLFLPYFNGYKAEPPNFKMEYCLVKQLRNEPYKLQMSVVQDIGGISGTGPKVYGLQISSLVPYITQDRSLLIDCKLIEAKDLQKDEVRSLKCEEIMPSCLVIKQQHELPDVVKKRWSWWGGSSEAVAFLKKLEADFQSMGRTQRAMETIKNISGKVKNSRYSLLVHFGAKNMEYITYGALYIVVCDGTVEALEEMLLLGLNLNTVYGCICSPALHWAIQDKDFERGLEKAKSLLANGANLHALDDKQANVLHWAAYTGNEKAVKFLIDEGLPINGVDARGQTPLHYAVINAQKGITCKIVEVLVYFGADKNVKDRLGKSPLEMLYGERLELREEIKKALQ